jgi:large subunit ribosomal protein L4
MSETRTVAVIGTKSAKAELPGDLFDVQTNVPLIHQVVVAQLAAARQGTHSTKTRSEVAGGGAKPWRQKGTGRARQGSRRAPQWTGGGIVHGPQPRSYAQRTPKKMIAAALRGALSDRARDGHIHVISEIVAGETPSTKAALLALAEIGGAKLLVVLDRDEDVAWLSLRNVASVHAIAVDQLNAYDVLISDDVVFTSAALTAFVAGPLSGSSEVTVTEVEEPAIKAEKPATKVEKVAKAEKAPKAAEPEKPAKAEKPAAKAKKAPKAEKADSGKAAQPKEETK